MAQEQLQQQLSSAKAACKASDSRYAQLQAQHQVQLNELTQQLQAAKQHSENLAQQHQQALADQLASATAATAAEHNHDLARLQKQYTECLSSHATAVAQLQQEVATTAAQAEDDMAAVGQQLSAMLQGNRNSQVSLREQLQQLQLEVAAVRGTMTSGGEGEEGVQQVLSSLIEVQQQLIGEGGAGLGGLMQEREQVRAQVRYDSYACTPCTA
jgi:chromosome segregation ATPase